MKYHKYQYHKSQLETTETARSTSRYPELYFTSGLQSSSYLILSVITYISFNSRYYHPIMDHIYTLSLLSYLMRSLSPTDYGYSFIETCGSSDVHQTFVFCSAMRAITSHIHVVLAVFVGFIVCMVLVKNINSYTGSYRSLLTILFLCAITSDCVLDDGETYHPTAFPTTMPSPEPTPRPTIEPIDYDFWSIQTTGTTPFPCTTDRAYAAGVDSSGIVYVGKGAECYSDFVAYYDPLTDHFVDDGCEECSKQNLPVSQHYTQTGDILYNVERVAKITYLDLSTTGPEWESLVDSTTGDTIYFGLGGSCLASTPDGHYLISLGGQDFTWHQSHSAAVEIYDLINEAFIRTANDLPEVRMGFGCVVHPYDDCLYALGGYIVTVDEHGRYTDIGDLRGDYYKLLMDDVDNIASYEWTTYSEESVLAVDIFNRLIAYDKYLIALGGGFHNSGTSFIAAWDLSSGAPVLFASTLELSGFEWSNSAYALFGNLIYVFGHDLAQPTNWQIITLSLPTPEPTAMTLSPTIVTSIPTTSPISYPNCNYKQKYKTTFTEVGKTWTNWYDGKVKQGRNAFLATYPGCHRSSWSSLEFFYQFVYDENARTLTFYAQFCCGTDKQFGSDYQVTWVPNGFGSKTEYVPNQAWIDHNTPLYDYTCKYKKDYEITLPDKVWPTWQQYCNKWIDKGRDAFLDEKPWCGYEDSLEFFYRFSYNSNAKE
eukprot:363583_1